MKNEFMTHEQEKKQEEELKKYFKLITPEISDTMLRRMEKAAFERVRKTHKGRYIIQLITSPWVTVPAAAASVVLVVSVMLLNSYEINELDVKGVSIQVAGTSDAALSGSEDLNTLKTVLASHSEEELARMDEHLAQIIDKPVDTYWEEEFVHDWDWETDGSYDTLADEDWL